MSPERLIEMANDIGAYFAFEPDRSRAVDGVVAHLERFWDPRMRRALVAFCAGSGDDALDPLVRDAVARLAAHAAAQPSIAP